jgi:hypothetical protein
MSRFKVKGTHVLQTRQLINEKLGEGAFATLVHETKEARELWPGVILPSTWYEIAPLQIILAIVARNLKSTVEEVTTHIATRNARNDLTSVYRAFLKVAGPHLTLSATHKLWSTYVSFGESRAIQNEPGIYMGECRGMPKHLLPWACGCWRGFIPTAIEISGGKNCVSEVAGKWQEDNDLWKFHFSVKYS